jgi:nicotinamide-nucleotide amidase
MNVHILAVGSELLTPFFQDTNSFYLTERLNDLGHEVVFKAVVGDERDSLARAVRQSLASADLVFLTGGLGPTKDDRTRDAVAEVLERDLVLREDVLQAIEERFRRRGKAMPSSNKKQALIVRGAEVLANRHGTAPGLWIARDGKTIILLPGPPFELKAICEEFVWPRLARERDGYLARIVLKTTGLTESEVEDRIADLYPQDPGRRLTVLASPGQIEIHLSAFSKESAEDAEALVAALGREIQDRLSLHVFSADGADLEEVVGRLLRTRRRTVAVAESCTGGLISHRFTAVSGSSAYYLEGLITYSDRAKIDRLGVPAETLLSHGAASAETARAMAEGARRKAGADFGLAVTGIAGPTGGTPEKPVGLVYAALSWDGGTDVAKNIFFGPRDRIKFQSSQKALDMLRRRLLAEETS